MSTFVLVHGSFFNGGWCWSKVVPLLESAGHKVKVVDLAGHGGRSAAPPSVTLSDYAGGVAKVIDAAGEPVVLVGHSMGGVVVTQTAEARPDAIRSLLYVGAFLPQNGQALVHLAQQDKESTFLGALLFDEKNGYHSVKPESVGLLFDANTPASEVAAIGERLAPEPLGPVATPVHTSASSWGRVPRDYIVTSEDRCLSPQQQRRMLAASPCRRVLQIASGHSPMITQPFQLAGQLLSLA